MYFYISERFKVPQKCHYLVDLRTEPEKILIILYICDIANIPFSRQEAWFVFSCYFEGFYFFFVNYNYVNWLLKNVEFVEQINKSSSLKNALYEMNFKNCLVCLRKSLQVVCFIREILNIKKHFSGTKMKKKKY